MKRGGAVYIMTNKNHTTFYIGVTSDLPGRVIKHIQKFYPKSFSAQYNLTKLVYYELFSGVVEAIAREKELKAGSRQAKIDLINKMNPDWKDLYEIDLKFW